MPQTRIEGRRRPVRLTPTEKILRSLEFHSEEVTDDDLLFLWKNKVYFTLIEVEGMLHLDWIKSRKCGRGDGTRFMLELCRLSDENCVAIELIPCPLGHVGLSMTQLVDFYRKFDFEYHGKECMRRLPKRS